MAIEVRHALESDGASVVALRRRLFQETDYMLWEADEFTQSADEESKRITRLNTRPNSLVILAEEGSTLVGLLTAVGGEVRRLRHSATLALGVAQSHWGQGVATRMLEHVVAWSASAGLHRLELTVHTTNLRAVAVYLRAGFQLEGVRRSSLIVGGRYVDEYLMSRLSDA